MKEININELMDINGGGPIGDFVGDVLSSGAQAIKTSIDSLSSLANTSYNTGKKLGNYIRNW